MLMNHRNFHFTQIPDKTNDVFSYEIMFLVIFPQWGLSHTTIQGPPQHHAKFQKKLKNELRENLRTDGRMNGRMDRLYFIGTFRPRVGVQ